MSAGRGVDTVFEAAGHPSAFRLSVEAVRPAGDVFRTPAGVAGELRGDLVDVGPGPGGLLAVLRARHDVRVCARL